MKVTPTGYLIGSQPGLPETRAGQRGHRLDSGDTRLTSSSSSSSRGPEASGVLLHTA